MKEGVSLEKGYVSTYTGNGKGKTTAAFGLALRALMAGKRVFVAQFIKSMKYKETKIEEYFDSIEILQMGLGCFIIDKAGEEDRKKAKDGLEICRKKLISGKYDLVILDEIFIATYFKMLTSQEIIETLKEKAPNTEVVMTGRYAPKEIIEFSDLVTEMKEVKHYYQQGVLSREGFDC